MRLPLLLVAAAALATPARADDGHRDSPAAAPSSANAPPDTPLDCGLLMSGQRLRLGESQTSCDGRFTLTLEADGNLVLRRAGVGMLWSSQTSHAPAHHLVMLPQGTLAIVDDAERVLWQSHPFGIAGSYARLQDDGDLGVFAPGGRPLWHTNTAQWPVEPPTACGTLRAGEGLVVDQQLTSCDGQVRLALSADGDLTVRAGDRVSFSTGTAGSAARYLRLEDDGELGLYGARGEVVWSSQVRGFFGAQVVVTGEGALLVVAASGEILWSSAAGR